jgi:hypothetical protein
MQDALGLAEPTDAPPTERRPRFEARAAFKDKQRKEKKETGLGLTKLQGAISGLKDYAAVHAIKEGEGAAW